VDLEEGCRRVVGGLLGMDGHTCNQQRRTAIDSRGVVSSVGAVWSRTPAFTAFCIYEQGESEQGG